MVATGGRTAVVATAYCAFSVIFTTAVSSQRLSVSVVVAIAVPTTVVVSVVVAIAAPITVVVVSPVNIAMV